MMPCIRHSVHPNTPVLLTLRIFAPCEETCGSTASDGGAATVSGRTYRGRRVGHALRWLGAVLVISGAASCSVSDGFPWLHVGGPKGGAHWLAMALESEQPDDRRRGINGLSESPEAATDWAIRVYDTVARTDRDTMVRRAALRAMSVAANGDRVPTVLKLLRSDRQRFSDVRPAPASVRWSAARLLLKVVHDYAYREDQRREIIDTLVERLPIERDVNVRLTLVDTLGYFPEREAAMALIDAMNGDGFAIRHAAEMALVSMTGVTHHHDPEAWRRWFNQTSGPFAKRGDIPEEMKVERPKPRWDWLGWWGQ